MASATTNEDPVSAGMLLLSGVAAALVLMVFGGVTLEYATLMSLSAESAPAIAALQAAAGLLFVLAVSVVVAACALAVRRWVRLTHQRPQRGL